MKVKSITWKVRSKTFLGIECLPQTPSGDLQIAANSHVISLARKLKKPLLLTLDAHMVRPESKYLQDIVLQNGNEDGWRFWTIYSQMNTMEAWDKWFSIYGGDKDSVSAFVEGVENNQAIVDMVEPLQFKKKLHLPQPEISTEISGTETERMEKYLIELIAKCGRLKRDPVYIDRLRKEIQVISRNPVVNFLPYFFMLYDICLHARENNIPVGPGRGSAAGCLISYLLMITHLDPIRFGLSFERFLSTGRINRGKFPDIDLDFGDVSPIVSWLEQKYGDRFSRISTVGTLKLKMAIRDISRVLLKTKENPVIADRVNNICKKIPLSPQGVDVKKWLYGYVDDNGNAHEAYLDTDADLRNFFVEFPAVQEAVNDLMDIPRSMGRHASAYIISDIPVNETVPTCRLGAENEVCTQFTMGPVEALGLIKFDLLGINTLKDISEATRLIKERRGIDIDIYNMPLEDSAVFDEFCKGKNETVFQFGGKVPTELCRAIKPRTIFDLSDITAAGRPGTMRSLMEDGKTTLIEAWKGRRRGDMPVKYVHPDVEEILKPTLGICIYQEQIMAMFQKCCGYSAERADEIREIVGKKKIEQMVPVINEVRGKLVERGWHESQIDSFVSLCEASASYSFNKSHSMSYAYVAYICQWLKTHYKIEWWAALLKNSDKKDLEAYAPYCSHLLYSPDINLSHEDFYIVDWEKDKIVFPLCMVTGIKTAGSEIINARKNGRINSLGDLYERVNRRLANLRVFQALIWSGCFDRLYNVKNITDRNLIFKEYCSLRGEGDKYQEYSELAIMQKQSLALPIGKPDYYSYVLKHYKSRKWNTLGMVSPVSLGYMDVDQHIQTAGAITGVKLHTDKKGNTMCFAKLVSGVYEFDVTVFASLYQTVASKFVEGAVVKISAKLQEFNSKRSLLADDIAFVHVPKLAEEAYDNEWSQNLS